MTQHSFLGLIEQSIRNHWEMPAMTDFLGETYYYKDVAREIDRLHDYFERAGIKRGDKVALCGKNSARWAIAFFATLSYGAVAVSILHEFDKDSVRFIVDHSDSRLFFADENIWNEVDPARVPKVETVFSLDDFALLKSSSDRLDQFHANASHYFEEKYRNGYLVNDMAFRADKLEELAVLNYTSGTTSSPKGVMIPYRSLWSNTKFANDNLEFIRSGDNIVCMLPMAHTYGLAFEILNSISMGCHIHFLIKTPLLNEIVHTKVRRSMTDFFGGNLVEVVIGGAALNSDVEKFLRKIRFPYTVGYGMTECGPLISYSFWSEYKERSSGRVVDRMQVKIDSPDPENVAGEILTKGTNVMLGYYKNEEATKETFTADGWLKTGDLGTLDKDNFVFIRGRDKNMILGASGQNIYPEEIEERINASPFVEESLAIEEEGKIVALIVPNREALDENGTPESEWESFFQQVIAEINGLLPAYSKLSSFRLQEEEFEKTPKRSIKRFKYLINTRSSS